MEERNKFVFQKTEVFKARLMGFVDQYLDNYINMVR